MGPIVIGVQPNGPDAVLQHAAHTAELLGTGLVFAHVDISNGTAVSAGFIDSAAALGAGTYLPPADTAPPERHEFPEALSEQIRTVLQYSTSTWRTAHLIGEPADALGRLADHLDAPMIIVGTREAGLSRTMHDFFSGSVAVHLTHRQHRPVLVIPTHPVDTLDDLPWTSTAGATPQPTDSDRPLP